MCVCPTIRLTLVCPLVLDISQYAVNGVFLLCQSISITSLSAYRSPRTPTVNNDPALEAIIRRVGDHEESVDEADEPDLARPLVSVHPYLPGMDVAENKSARSALPSRSGSVQIAFQGLVLHRSAEDAQDPMVGEHGGCSAGQQVVGSLLGDSQSNIGTYVAEAGLAVEQTVWMEGPVSNPMQAAAAITQKYCSGRAEIQ